MKELTPEVKKIVQMTESEMAKQREFWKKQGVLPFNPRRQRPMTIFKFYQGQKEQR